MSGASLPSWARKGVKVVCVDDGVSPGRVALAAIPPVGPVLSVVGTSEDPYGEYGNTLVIEGYPNLHDGIDVGWRVARFRPAVEPKTEAEDVAMFHDIARQKLPEAV